MAVTRPGPAGLGTEGGDPRAHGREEEDGEQRQQSSRSPEGWDEGKGSNKIWGWWWPGIGMARGSGMSCEDDNNSGVLRDWEQELEILGGCITTKDCLF